MIDSIVNKTLFITGSKKNAGKTTFLNYLLPKLRKEETKLCYLSIGIDGETEDAIFGTPKPKIYAEEEDFVITCEAALSATDAKFEFLEVFPYRQKLGRLVLVKILRAGSIELVGPGDNTKLKTIIENIRNNFKIQTVLVDGAVNRVTQISSASNSEFIYVLKVTQNDITQSINQIKILSKIKDFALFPGSIKQADNFWICDGAFTSLKVSKIPKEFSNILINDFTKIFLNWNELSELLKTKKIFYKEKYKLNCISVNLYDVSREDFLDILTQNNINDRIVFNPYECI